MNTEITTYTYPIIKILISASICIILFYRDRIFPFNIQLLKDIMTAITMVIIGSCILCTVVSACEILELYWRRVENKRNVETIKTKRYPIEHIIEMIEREDILEVEIKVHREIVKIGCASDMELSTKKFFDKVYYFGEKEYREIETFREAISAYGIGEILEVVSIDGIAQK